MKMYFKRMKDEWTGLVEQADPLIRAKAAEIAVAHAHYLSIEFYRIVRIDPHAEEFLSNEQVERQLKSAMERWIINVLSAQVDDVERLIQIQHTVAEVHARIGIPVEIVEMGFRVLKKILYPVIFSSDYSAVEKLQVYHFSINSIDIAMEVMTRAFTFSDSSASKEDENYRIFSLLENAEEEKERQIASILSWEIDIIYKVLLDSDLGSSLPLSQADFGLWFNHKGRHYFSGIAEVGHISRLIQDFDGIFNQTMRNTRNLNNRSLRVKFLLQIRNTVSQIITLLRELFEEVSRHEVGMDVLTKLLNRRFLPTIFKREIAHANRTGTPLSVLIIDVDKFKEINDTWGHNTGDEILRKVSQAFYDNVRSSDYVFRYGGDEFIIVLTEASENETLRTAERIRSRVEKTKLKAANGEDIALSLSIGAAMFNGHPDYERLIQVQNAQSWSATIRQRDGAPAGILQIKTSSGAETSAFIERVADISQHMAALALEQEKSRQHIEQLIQFDPMTGLPKRNNLHNYLDDLVDKAVSPVVYLIGVDHIQDVIDSLGYAWADQALLEVVNRFREKLKPDQYLCRIEGTQFVLVSLENDVSNITQIADELRNVVSKPIMIDDKPFPLTLSIGISYDVGKNRDYLLSTAHNAMDYIRKNGGNGWQFFSPAMNEMVKERLVLGAALKEAISNNQLKLVYQPQIFAETGELYGIEALARWHDPQHGHVPPSRFIPLAEEIGEIENIGRWVIAEACRQLAEWRSQNIHIPALSVNLSALHFRSNQLPNQVSDAMHAWGIDGHQLTVEITESMMMEHDTEIFKRIQILRDMGVGLSVDDFGTGFSGLSRLVSLPVTEIKIDKSFVDRCLTEKRILALLEAITSIGQSLNLTVVAEGVETKEQFEMLRKIHCRVIQGYFFSRPLPAEEIPGWMSSVLPLKI
ncbi:oxygen-sensing cyclic-di-GMP phosphodiesterase [Escherichia coli]|nr:oxygen-sensing cyclic-di-GMP phosphodiesterase [Escherichia coli]EGI4489879.1 oxygen-sensing cyclic-di-GMP phosphodiesterase [Escherichia coli]EHP7654538.1 oxygen-sensing cyclic-di-GMP phosphodiesterase [Escherichia coli]EHR1018583.1 oxygen-sensing cyclic-di-GMP phosphodiesterase [Escherichia coli]EJQ5638828.1 oxygen-sensing cyclic-di-GMP phosphodiesterase [Escherichia coli]